jgi:pilus assembly protein CpaE
MTTIKKIKVQLAIHTKPLAENFRKIVADTAGMQIEDSGNNLLGLLILELGQDSRQDFKRIDTLLAENKVGEIFLTGENPDPNILMQAMRLGVKEFFPLPLNQGDVRTALDRFMERHQKAPVEPRVKNGRIISICGGKGGVGATTVAVNLAVAYSNRKQPLSVALLDMNTIFGEIPLFLEISPKFHWGEITKNIERLDNTFLMNVLTRHSSGVHVLPSPAYLNGHHQPTPSIMQRLLGLMRQLFDVVIIDGGQTLNDAALKAMQMSDEVLLVSTLSLPCLSNTSKLLRSFTDLGYIQKERIKVILNRFLKKNEITLEDAEAGIGQKVFFSIPNDYKTTMAAINSGKPLSDLAPQSSIAGSIIDLSDKLIPVAPGETKKRWSLFKR